MLLSLIRRAASASFQLSCVELHSVLRTGRRKQQTWLFNGVGTDSGEESVIRSSGADFGRLIALDVLVNPSYEHVTSHVSDRSTQDAQGDAEDAHVTEIVEGL
jgi:hypothetical protein